jgi:hypothetical protein
MYLMIVVSYVTLTITRLGAQSLLASDIQTTLLVESANRDRQRSSIPPLKYNKKLELAAYKKAEDMFKKQYWAHFGPNNETPWQFITGAGYSYSYAGENLAKGFFESETVHKAWMDSPSHRENIMNGAFDEVGIAIMKGKLQGSDVFLVVEMFGSTLPRNGVKRTNYPILKITFPQDGDILPDGAFTIRGEQSLIKNNNIDFLINKEYLGSLQVADKTFLYEPIVPISTGEVTLSVRGVGTEEEYLSDQVSFKVMNEKIGDKNLNSCIKDSVTGTNLVISFVCTELEATLGIKIGDTFFRAEDNNPTLVYIPIASVGDSTKYEVTLTQKSGTTNIFNRALPQGAVFSSGAIAPNGVTPSDLIGIPVFLSGILVTSYAFILTRKKALVGKKHEVTLLVLLTVAATFILSMGIIYV